MTDINLKTLTPDTSLPTTGFLFGADSQASTNPSVYSTQTVATTLLGSTSLTGDTLTGSSSPVLNLTQTWNNGSTTFEGAVINITRTNAGNNSTSFTVKNAGANVLSVYSVYPAVYVNGGYTMYWTDAAGPSIGGNRRVTINSSSASGDGGINLGSDTYFGWNSTPDAGSGNRDLFLRRKAAANLQLGAADAASPVAQTLSVQSVVAGTSSTAGADFTLTGSQNTGAGLAGNLIVSTGFSNTVGTATVTITIATPGVITWTAHGLVTGSPVVFTTTGALPTGITAGTTYFAITSSTLGVNTFQIATSAANAAAGTAITTSGTQSGVQTATTSATVQSPLMTTTTFGPSGLTGSQTTPVLNLAQTWNTSGQPTALKLNVTNTASQVQSKIMDLQVDGASLFAFRKEGVMVAKQGVETPTAAIGSITGYNGVGVFIGTTAGLNFTNGSLPYDTVDLILRRKAAANLQLGLADAATPVAQKLSVQSIVGGGGTPNLSAAAYPFTITGAQGTGQGAGGSIIFQTAPAAVSSGNGQNGLTDTLTLDSVGSVRVVRALIVANLPGTPLAGMIARVSDASAPVIGTTVAGGGAAYALVNYNGANWTVIGV